MLHTHVIQNVKGCVGVSVLNSLQRWGKKTKSKNPSLQEHVDVECGKVLYSTTKKGNILEKERCHNQMRLPYMVILMAYLIRSCESERDQINNIKGREK